MTPHLTHDPWRAAPAAVPDGVAVAAIGDIHGEVDLYRTLLAGVVQVLDETRAERKVLIRLGDYGDRGQDSHAAWLMVAEGLGRPDIEEINLLGNHDVYLRDALTGAIETPVADAWLMMNGGTKLLQDFGAVTRPADTEDLRETLEELVEPVIKDAVGRLTPRVQIGSYVFVHAGLDPRLPLDSQDESTLVWIREPFLNPPEWPFDVCVVHGHTVHREPVVRPHRVGLDTGGYAHGVLTGAVFQGDRMRLLQART